MAIASGNLQIVRNNNGNYTIYNFTGVDIYFTSDRDNIETIVGSNTTNVTTLEDLGAPALFFGPEAARKPDSLESPYFKYLVLAIQNGIISVLEPLIQLDSSANTQTLVPFLRVLGTATPTSTIELAPDVWDVIGRVNADSPTDTPLYDYLPPSGVEPPVTEIQITIDHTDTTTPAIQS